MVLYTPVNVSANKYLNVKLVSFFYPLLGSIYTKEQLFDKNAEIPKHYSVYIFTFGELSVNTNTISNSFYMNYF